MTAVVGGDEGVVARAGRGIGWRTTGAGPPLLLLNGYGGTAADWDPTFLAALGAGHTVVLADHRGMGTSSWGDDAEPATVATMAADALAVLDALALPTAAVVGWSMGGFVAQALAAAAPERVRALGLLATDPGGPASVRAAPEVWARLTDTSGTAREQATRLLGLLFPSPLAEQVDADVGDLVAGARAALDVRVLRAQEAAMAAWHRDAPPSVPDRVPPTVVACGTDDVVIPPANAGLVAARWRAPEPAAFAGAGHALMAQAPTDLATLLHEHLTR